MVKDLDEETSRSYCWNLELVYLKCGNISISTLFTLYRKAMPGSLKYAFFNPDSFQTAF